MATSNEKAITQIEQDSTPETNLDVSQKNQEIEKEINDSKKNQEILTVEQNVNKESKAIQNMTIETKTLEQEEISETKVLEHETDTEKKILQDEVKAETNTLEKEVKTRESIAKTISEKEIAKIIDNATLKIVANEWIIKCEKLLNGLKGNRESKKELKEKVGRAIKSMKAMIDDEHIYETKQNEYKNHLGKIIYYYYENREPARQTIMMGGRVPVIKGIADTKREARRDSRRAKDNAEYQIDISELKQNTALYNKIGVSANEWGNYCDFIGQGGIAVTHPVFVQHTIGFNNIKAYDPDLYRKITPKGQITYSTYCQRDPKLYKAYCRDNNIVCAPQSYNRRFGNRFANMMEQIFPEKMNRDPRQRQAWSNIGSLLAIGGTIFMGFKALQSLKKGKDGERNWGGFFGWTAGTLALLNADTVINTIQDAFNWHPAEKSRMLSEAFKKYGFPDETAREMVDRYVGAPVTTMSALHFIPIYELESEHILEDKNGEFEFNYINYEKYINQLRWTNSQKEQVLKAGEKLDKDKSIGAGLKAFGITTRDKLRSLFGSDKKKTLADTDEVKNGWKNLEKRVTSGVNAELYKNGLRIKDPEKVDAIMKEYEEKKDNTNMNELILEWMKAGLLEFNDSRDYTLNEMIDGPYKDLMNLENMTIKGFRYSEGANEVKFSTYKELFDAVYTTEKIKYIFKGRIDAKDEIPFHIGVRGQIEFNNTKWYELHKGDDVVISLKKLKTDLPTIKDNRDAYNSYLNDWRIKSLGK